MNTRKRWNLTVISAVLVTLVGCGGSAGTDPSDADPGGEQLQQTPVEKLQLTQTASCDIVTDYVADSIADLILNSGYPACPNCRLSR